MKGRRQSGGTDYFPRAGGDWERAAPEEGGFDAAGLADAVAFAAAHDSKWPRDLRAVIAGGTFDPPPWNRVFGPTRPRGSPCGIISRGGRIVAEWGDTGRADMVFSVTKSYLAAVAGFVADATRPVRESAPDDGFVSAQNRDITWQQLLQQTSEWSGTLWGMPDTVDRNRQLSPQEDGSRLNQLTPPQPPGSYWDYNDIRVNRLCLSLTLLFHRPLDQVLRERIMTPIGAGPDWQWSGYDDSVVEIDGRQVPVAVGGGHWGGGLVTSVNDDARFGLLIERRGRWGERQVIAADWIARMLTPCPLNPLYGGLWWLNSDRRLFATAPASSAFALGVGLNMIWVDAELDLVAALHWIDEPALPGFIDRVMAAIR